MWCVIYNSRALSRFKFSHLRVKAPQIFDLVSENRGEKNEGGGKDAHNGITCEKPGGREDRQLDKHVIV